MPGTMIGAGMGLGMGVGIGGTMGAQMGNIAQEGMRPATAAPPPPVTSVQIYVYLNNQQAGPYDMPILQQLVIRGVLTRQTLVWKEGMPAWATAETVPELQSLFASVPPPVPPVPPVPPTM